VTKIGHDRLSDNSVKRLTTMMFTLKINLILHKMRKNVKLPRFHALNATKSQSDGSPALC